VTCSSATFQPQPPQIFASHAIGGIVGNLLTGLFAQSSIASFDGSAPILGGWLDHNYRQLGIQLADSVSGLAYSFVMTTIICWIMHFIPGLRLRVSEEAEIIGIDDAEMGEFAYDYVGIEAELGMKDGDYREGAAGGGREPMHRHSFAQARHMEGLREHMPDSSSGTPSEEEKAAVRDEIA
jgi:Amt family ammonium transporter